MATVKQKVESLGKKLAQKEDKENCSEPIAGGGETLLPLCPSLIVLFSLFIQTNKRLIVY